MDSGSIGYVFCRPFDECARLLVPSIEEVLKKFCLWKHAVNGVVILQRDKKSFDLILLIEHGSGSHTISDGP